MDLIANQNKAHNFKNSASNYSANKFIFFYMIVAKIKTLWGKYDH